jgi:hypothetical protein
MIHLCKAYLLTFQYIKKAEYKLFLQILFLFILFFFFSNLELVLCCFI